MDVKSTRIGRRRRIGIAFEMHSTSNVEQELFDHWEPFKKTLNNNSPFISNTCKAIIKLLPYIVVLELIWHSRIHYSRAFGKPPKSSEARLQCCKPTHLLPASSNYSKTGEKLQRILCWKKISSSRKNELL